MRSLVKYWKREGIKICVDIEESLGVSPLLELALEKAEFVRNSLTQCGFIINSEKSVWQPQKELIWLRIKINLINSRFTIPEN